MGCCAIRGPTTLMVSGWGVEGLAKACHNSSDSKGATEMHGWNISRFRFSSHLSRSYQHTLDPGWPMRARMRP